MNSNYDAILSSDEQTRAGLFTTTALRLGTTPENVEKDFWVCWTLDALFNGLSDGPRLLFKGGTSLSKGFGLIQRFSEDIDVTVFRDDLGQAATVAELQALSRKKREAALDAIKVACEAYLNGPLLDGLSVIAAATAARTGLPTNRFLVTPHGEESQTLLVRYPTVTPSGSYIDKVVKIESGAKSALDPHSVRSIRPYTDDDAPGLDLTIANVTIVDAERTFWDKVVILHGLRRWFDIRGELRAGGHRISRHYYDAHALMQSEVGERALANPALGVDCVAHARMFFNRPDFDLASAVSPTFALCPEGSMYDELRRDYAAMSAMIFGTPPRFDAVIESVASIQSTLNSQAI